MTKINLTDNELQELKYHYVDRLVDNMSLKDLLKSSQNSSDKKEREIRFADAGQHFQSLDKDDWNNLKENL